MTGDTRSEQSRGLRARAGRGGAEAAPAGEAAILARILPHLGRGPAVELGPGDDAAVVRLPSPRLVVTTDTLVEGHDFLPAATTAAWIGHKAAVQNLADVAAMGARPSALVVALSAPTTTPVAVFEELMGALARRAEADGTSVVGGDLGRAAQLTVTVTALGALEEGRSAVTRTGARPGDVLAVGAPRLGRSAAGLALILGERARVGGTDLVPHGPEAVDGSAAGSVPVLRDIADPSAAALVRWHDAPDPDLTLGWGAGRGAHAMMDLSDGLVRDGGRIAAASRVTLDLDATALGPDVEQLAGLAAELGADPWAWVLHGAEEHAMLAAFAPGEVPAGFRPIGQAHEPGPDGPAVLLDGAPIDGEGWDHFA